MGKYGKQITIVGQEGIGHDYNAKHAIIWYCIYPNYSETLTPYHTIPKS